MKLADLTPAERRGFLIGLERAAQLLEERFGERVQRRHAVNAIRSQKEKSE